MISMPVTSLGSWVVVIAGPIGFDDEALPAPEKVDLERIKSYLEDRVASWNGNLALGKQRQELCLEAAAKARAWRVAAPVRENPAQQRTAASTRAFENGIDLRNVEQLQNGGLLDSPTQGCLMAFTSEIDNGASGAGAWNGVSRPRLLAQRQRDMSTTYSCDLATGFHRRDDMNSSGRLLPKAE